MTAFGWFLAAVCFSLTLIIETSSWCLRARAEVTNQGLYNSRVNIYLYTARFFYLVFMVLMAWAVDRGATHHQILGVISGAAGLGLIAHLVYAFSGAVARFADRKILLILLPEVATSNHVALRFQIGHALFGWSAFAAFFLMMGVTLPFVVASLFPESRMMISSLGQVVNAVGTVVVLFKVDSAMYQSMDTGRLPLLVGYFVAGRIVALATVFCASSASFAASGVV
jgi:hypothetical protein